MTKKELMVHMFMRHGSDEYVYRGLVTLAGDVYQEVETDKNNHLRKVYKFPLKFSSTEAHKASADQSAEVERILEKRAAEMDLKSLFDSNEKIVEKINLNEKLGNVKIRSTAARAKRDPKVSAYVVARAKGRCQLCGALVNTNDVDKPARLVGHHEPPLQDDEGRDDKFHAAALCDNCHARRHLAGLSESVRSSYIAIIKQNILESEARVIQELQEK